MASSATIIEFSKFCPQLDCGETLDFDDGANFCGNCGNAFNACVACRATNRILAQFCRGCGKELDSNICPMQPGLSAEIRTVRPINALGNLRPPYPLRLETDVIAPPIAADGLLIVSTTTGRVVLISESNGCEIGLIGVGQPVVVAPALREGTLFVAAGNRLLAFDLSSLLEHSGYQSADLVWSIDTASDVVGQPLVIDDNAVYVTAFRRDGPESIVEAISRLDGKRLWAKPITIETNQITAPALIDGRLLFSTQYGHVVLVNSGNGEKLSEFSLDRNIDMLVPPFLSRRRLLLTTVGGEIIEVEANDDRLSISHLYSHGARITALGANDRFIAIGHMAGLTLMDTHGQVKWSYEGFDSISVTPVIAEGTVFAIDNEGNGLLFNERSSNPVMKIKLFMGEVSTPPIVTRSKIVAVSGDGCVAAVDWR